ncbi:general secretion pathway protein GspB [Idiomarina abyssalis]|uniref:general secretion pathway protein GspB n=1 Tax=Idiomarina abyssalis TaxID=86102 RepID=UPI003A93E356
MSSLLKALKQQQSPLLKQRSILDASLMATDNSTRRWGWLIWPAIIVAGGVLGAGTAQWLAKEPEPETVAAERFSWGETETVEAISWDAEPQEETVEVAKSSELPEPASTDASQPEQTEPQREALDLSAVSPDLLERFEAAVNDTGSNNNDNADTSVIPPLGELSRSFQRQVPAFSYDSHMYRSSASQRWIELNGQRLYEGDALNQLTILRIEPQKVVLVMDSQAFSQAALEDWQP